jgi:glycosyltransferase involved in cell wall biosynthesis
MMKVAFDISILGWGYYENTCRAGIYRAVENIAKGLIASPECDVHLCSGDNLRRLFDTIDYLENGSPFQQTSIPHSKLLRRLFSLERELYAPDRGSSNENKVSVSFPRKVVRRPLYSLNEWLETVCEPVSEASLNGVDIYHSNFRSLPKRVQGKRNLKKFLTVYDKFHLELIDGITPDTFALCISQSALNDLMEFTNGKFDPAFAFVAHLAASPHNFLPCAEQERIEKARRKFGIPEGQQYFLTVNSLEPRKNVDHTLRCFARLVREQNIKDLHFVLVGAKSWGCDYVHKAVEEMPDLQDRISITGWIDDDDLAPLYSGSIAFFYMSLYEGFGIPPLEAMQCGIPVVTSNTSSLPEVVGDAGIMLDPADADGLCQAMWQLYSQPDLRSELAAKSLVQSKKFSWDKCAQDTISAYRKALGG